MMELCLRITHVLLLTCAVAGEGMTDQSSIEQEFMLPIGRSEIDEWKSRTPLTPDLERHYRLLDAQLTGDVVLPGDSEYEKSCETFFKNHDSNFQAIIYAENTNDIIASLKFVQEHDLSLSVRSTGHDYNGRSSGNGTVNLFLTRMKDITVTLNDSLSDTGESLTTGTGNSFREIIDHIDKYNHRYIISGFCAGVGPGGFFMGGGMSSVSRMHGLGVDNVVKFVLVKANGEVVEVTSQGYWRLGPDGKAESSLIDDGGDIWWAVRGGGYGFGVVASVTYTVHTNPGGFTFLNMRFPFITDDGIELGKELLDKLLKMNLVLSRRWTVYIQTDNYDTFLKNGSSINTQKNGLVMIMAIHHGHYSLQTTGELRSIWTFREKYVDHRSHHTLHNYKQVVNAPNHIGRMWEYSGGGLITTHAVRNQLVGSVLRPLMTYSHRVQCLFQPLSGAVSDYPLESSAVGRALRESAGDFTCTTQWKDNGAERIQAIATLRHWTETHFKPSGISEGAYFAEANINIEDWGKDFWGEERYERLLRIKELWDPDRIFRCHLCVGGEQHSPGPEWTQITNDKRNFAPIIGMPLSKHDEL